MAGTLRQEDPSLKKKKVLISPWRHWRLKPRLQIIPAPLFFTCVLTFPMHLGQQWGDKKQTQPQLFLVCPLSQISLED